MRRGGRSGGGWKESKKAVKQHKKSGLPDILVLCIGEQHLMAVNEAQIKSWCGFKLKQ